MSLHESTHPLVRYLWESAEARDENGETEAASALLEAARYAEALERSQATPRNEPVAPRIQQLALELYWVAVDHALGPDDVNKDTAVDAMAQRLHDVLLGIHVGMDFASSDPSRGL